MTVQQMCVQFIATLAIANYKLLVKQTKEGVKKSMMMIMSNMCLKARLYIFFKSCGCRMDQKYYYLMGNTFIPSTRGLCNRQNSIVINWFTLIFPSFHWF